MKIWLTSDNVDWDTSRYHYPAEQMLLTLFPEERPEYPDGPAPTSLAAETNAVIFTLHRGKKLTNLSALLLRSGRWNNGVVRFPSEKLDQEPTALYHTLQHAVKESFYKAATLLLGHDLPWGSLTGVRPTKLPTRALWAGASAKEALDELVKTYHVSPPKARLALRCAQESVAVKSQLEANDISLYIGIPFCPSRCAYCSFISSDIKGALALVEPYVDALCGEIAQAGELIRSRKMRVRSVYMGGGTPTTLEPEQLDAVLTALDGWLDRESLVEFTVEAGRPDTITPEKLAVLKAHKVDRISVNPQTLQDPVLEAIGRKHTVAQFLASYDLARSYDFSAINTDLIAGLPGDTLEGFRDTLDRIIQLYPEEITVHTLALKHGSTLMNSPQPLPDAGTVAAMLDYAETALTGAGFHPYYLYRQKYMTGALENIGWSRRTAPGFYNIVMMEELSTVLALGSGGVTKWIDGPNITRQTNPKYPKEYIERVRNGKTNS